MTKRKIQFLQWWNERQEELVICWKFAREKNDKERESYFEGHLRKNVALLEQFKSKEKLHSYYRERRKENIQFRLAHYIRLHVRGVLKGNLKNRYESGCSAVYLRAYLETKFKDGMNWENYTWKGWHVDHIIPLSLFDLTDRGQYLQACHYTNLQPMWAKDNLLKGKKLIYESKALI